MKRQNPIYSYFSKRLLFSRKTHLKLFRLMNV